MEDLGGAKVHAEITGNAHFFALSEYECFQQIKNLLSFLPWSNTEKPEKKDICPKEKYNITRIVPDDARLPYDVRDVVKCIVDDSYFLEIQEMWAANIVIGFGKINGQTIGFVCNQPLVLAGVLDVDSSNKAARFIRFCDAFNISIVTLVDLPDTFRCRSGASGCNPSWS